MLKIAGTRPAVDRDQVEPAPAELRDLRFRALLGEAGWSRLPQAVRDRFSKRLRPGMAVTYVGEITESRRNLAGWTLAQLCRLIGAPLPLYDDLGVAAVVTVTDDGQARGQFWTRMYNQARGFPQVIHSSKRFAGPTGLEEYLGCGFGIALTVTADETALHFHSHGYFLALGPAQLGPRLKLPAWLAPGALTISHIDQGDGGFAFVLDLRHPLLGRMLRQVGMFRERPAGQEQRR
jgi:hypothetical protein